MITVGAIAAPRSSHAHTGDTSGMAPIESIVSRSPLGNRYHRKMQPENQARLRGKALAASEELSSQRSEGTLATDDASGKSRGPDSQAFQRTQICFALASCASLLFGFVAATSPSHAGDNSLTATLSSLKNDKCIDVRGSPRKRPRCYSLLHEQPEQTC